MVRLLTDEDDRSTRTTTSGGFPKNVGTLNLGGPREKV